ncbi:sulfite exporter TauE/SafE family protein [Amorphus sp. MBR-141]
MFADPLYTLPVVAALLGLYVVGGFVKGAASFGQPMVTISVAVLFVPVPAAIAIAVVPSFLANLVQGYANRESAPQLKPYWPFYVCLIAGILIGLRIFALLDQNALQAIIGMLLVVFSVTQLAGLSPPLSPPPRGMVLAASGLISGLAAGTTSFVAFPSLPVFIAYRLDRKLFALVTSVMFFITMLMVGGGLTLLGLFGRGELIMGLACCVPSFFGQKLGLGMRDRMSVSALRLFVNIVLCCVGLGLILKYLGIGFG